jgi:Tetratricopeptide repeat
MREVQSPVRQSNAGNDVSASQVLSGLTFGSGLILLSASLLNGSWSGGRAPFPYVWRDVAIVHLLCALPLVWVSASMLLRKLQPGAASLLAALLMGLSVLPLVEPSHQRVADALLSDPWLGIVVRSACAFGFVLSLAIAGAMLFGIRRMTVASNRQGDLRAIVPVGFVVLVLLPWTYVDARCRHDLKQMGDYLGQSRLGEARALARDLLVLNAGLRWRDRPLREIAADLDRDVHKLEERVAVKLPLRAPPFLHLQRAEELAMLGRTDEALEALKSIKEPAASPYVANLRGNIHESRGEWETALVAYRQARQEWDALPASPVRSDELLRAVTGIALSQRKLGNYVEAEKTYQQLLSLSDSAETHYLLAQFYEDAQHADKARTHARRAMEIAPDRYRGQGERLINKLAVHHFGCLGVFAAEH